MKYEEISGKGFAGEKVKLDVILQLCLVGVVKMAMAEIDNIGCTELQLFLPALALFTHM